MEVIAAIKFFQEHYWDIDEHDRHGEMMMPWRERGVTPETIFDILMEQPEECEEYGNNEWVEMVEKEKDPIEAGWLIIEWIWTRQWARRDARAIKEYLATKPDYEEYESPLRREFDRPPRRCEAEVEESQISEVTALENESSRGEDAAKPRPVAEEESLDAQADALIAKLRAERKTRSSDADFMFARRGLSGGPDPDAD